VLTDFVRRQTNGRAEVDGWNEIDPSSQVPSVFYPIKRDGSLGRRIGSDPSPVTPGENGPVRPVVHLGQDTGVVGVERVRRVSQFLAVRDGLWQLTGEEGTSFTFWVVGGGTVIENPSALGAEIMYGGTSCTIFTACLPCAGFFDDRGVAIGAHGQLNFPDTQNSGSMATGMITSPTDAEGTYRVRTGLGCDSGVLPWSAHFVSGPSPVYLLQAAGELPSPGICADVLIVGARGNGESTTRYLGMGVLLDTFAQAITRRLADIRVKAEGLPYSTLSPLNLLDLLQQAAFVGPEGLVGPLYNDYVRSVDGGVRTLVELVRARSRECPRELIVLAGYSEGANVVGNALARITDGNVVAVELWGDPQYSPDSPSDRSAGTSWGVFNFRHDRDRPRKAWQSRTESWCNEKDVVCQGNILVNNLDAHGDYAKTLRSAESFTIRLIRARLTT
jgi:hypothetical protein